MYNMFQVLLMWIATIFIAFVVTPVVKKIAFIIGAVDNPDKRRVNKKIMPTMGGVSIFLTSYIALFFLQPVTFKYVFPLFLASFVIVITGVYDDIFEIKPVYKILGILIAALIVYYLADIRLSTITIPVLGTLSFGWLSLPITLIWIIGITNAINLIDGLDGLATGVSIISLTTMGIIGYFFIDYNHIPQTIFTFTIVCAALGFLPYNFYPASIFLGDTGALFLGFTISIISLQGLKNATIISFVLPILILGVPITDTFFAIVRRRINKQPVTAADKNHLHHRLMFLGLSHRQTVLFLYLFSIIFSIISMLFPLSSGLSMVLLILAVIIGVQLFVESIGLLGENYTPVLSFIKKIFKKVNKN